VASLAAVHFSGCAAGPAHPHQDRDLTTYNFFVTLASSGSASTAALNGAYLTLVNGNSTVGVDPNAEPLEVYSVASTLRSGQYELHDYPVGSVDYMVILAGASSTSLLPLELVDHASKAASAANFTAFDFGSASDIAIGEGTMTFNGRGSNSLAGWKALSTGNGTWTVDWFDGTGVLAGSYIPIQIEYSQV